MTCFDFTKKQTYVLTLLEQVSAVLTGSGKVAPILLHYFFVNVLVLWRCWLGGRKGIRPVKSEWWGAGVVICLEWDADLHMAQLSPEPLTISCFSKIQIAFTFLVPDYPGSPGQRAVKRVCACVCISDTDSDTAKVSPVQYRHHQRYRY